MQRDREEGERLDALDLLIQVLVQHEEKLNEITKRLKTIIDRLESEAIQPVEQ